ncbi:serine O-acetyltransferase EpsC [Neptunitalea lumnitzerae]|nr:serine O-acetyltransferase EpsC [Neptunitalea sp. Y10]
MNKKELIEQIKNLQPAINFDLKKRVEQFTDTLFKCLFDVSTDLESHLDVLLDEFITLAEIVCWDEAKNCTKIWDQFVYKLPQLLASLNEDASSIEMNDPAAESLEEVYLAYPGFYAIAVYRISHELYKLGFPLVPRLMTEFAHKVTGVDIHPGAQIGKSFFIDHATGVVIGETTVIKDNVKIYQGVTLGALYVDKELKNKKRHPTVESNVTIYANATILGGDTVIGENSIIGGNVWVTNSIPSNSLVYHSPEIKVKELK